jgi:hypothetical protein
MCVLHTGIDTAMEYFKYYLRHCSEQDTVPSREETWFNNQTRKP